MRVLLINRYDFMDGGADRVFLNTYGLLAQAGASYSSPISGASAGEGVGGEGDLQVDIFTQKDLGISAPVNPRSLNIWAKIKLVSRYLYDKKVAVALDRKIQEFKPDVAHVHLIFGTLSVSVLMVLKKNRIPVVMTLHDYRLICPANAFIDKDGKVCEKCKKFRYYNCLINRCSGGNVFYSSMIMLEAYMRKYIFRPLNLVDHFIFVSQFALKKHLEYEPRYTKKSSHLYNMDNPVVDISTSRGDYFLYYGRLSREKGIKTLIEAAKLANINLIIAGSGPQEAELRDLIPDTRHLTPFSVSFVGFKSGLELQYLIAGSSFVVLPTECYDNNPMAIVESFSIGKPVIGSRIGGIPELVATECGLLFEPRNVESLVEALKSANGISNEDYENMAIACKDFAGRNFDRHLHLDQLIGIYNQVVNRA